MLPTLGSRIPQLPTARLALTVLLSLPLQAQWIVKAKRIEEKSRDEHILLRVDLPVLTGDANPAARKAINHALGLATEVDKLRKEAQEAIHHHEAVLAKKKAAPADDEEDDEDFPDEHTVAFQAGLNDGHLFSLGLEGYWHGGGGVTGNPYAKGCTFNAETGQALGMADLLGPAWEKPLRARMAEALQDQAEDLFPNWRTSLETTPFEAWFTDKGMEIRFPKYSLGPGSAGLVAVRLPFEKLRPLVPSDGLLRRYLK